MVLFDATSQRRHVALQAGRARLPARLLPSQERRLAAEQAASNCAAGSPRNWRRCRPTTSWTCTRTCPRQWRTKCRRRRDRRLPMADRRRTACLQRRIQRTGFQGGLTGIAAAPADWIPRSCKCSPAAASTCPQCSLPAAVTGAPIKIPERSNGCSRIACSRFMGCHLIDGAGHWVQQEQADQVSNFLLGFVHETMANAG